MCATENPDKQPAPDDNPSAAKPPAAEGLSLLSGFRTSQRIVFMTSLYVHFGAETGRAAVEQTRTLNVSASGALIVLITPVQLGHQVRLVNPKTKKEIDCHIRRVNMAAVAGGPAQVGVQFVEASPDFWGIASPPADWDPAWVPPPQNIPLELSLDAPPPAPVPQLEKPAASTPLNKLVEQIKRDMAKPTEATTNAKPKRSRVLKGLILSVAAAALFTVWIARRESSTTDSAAKEQIPLTAVSVEDAPKIPELENLRLATVEDFDAGAVSWLRSSGQQVGGRIPGNYFGGAESNAYVFVGKTNERRVVILAGGVLRYYAEYPAIAIAARVPKELMQQINWANPAPPDSDRDGLLIVRAADSPNSAVVLFVRGSEVVSATPSDYRQIPFGPPH